MITAIYIKHLDGFTGEAALYRLSRPIEYDEPWDKDDPPAKTTDHVVISATVAMFTGSETYIFPANKNGEIVDFGELEGSYRGGLDHRRAIELAGWSLASESET